METPPESQGWLASALAGMGAALLALGTWAWNYTHKKIDSVMTKADGKASTEELNRLRDDTRRIFDKVDELGDRTEVRFATIERAGHERHVELLNAIHSIKKK